MATDFLIRLPGAWRFALLIALWPGTPARAQVVGAASLGPLVGVQVIGPVRKPVFGGLGGLGFVTGRWFFGPELGLAWGAQTRIRVLGLVGRVSASGERFRPFLVAGAGSYAWNSRSDYVLPGGSVVAQWSGVTFLSGSVGGGAELGGRGGRTATFEVRYHGVLQRTGYPPVSRGLVTAGVGLRFQW